MFFSYPYTECFSGLDHFIDLWKHWYRTDCK